MPNWTRDRGSRRASRPYADLVKVVVLTLGDAAEVGVEVLTGEQFCLQGKPLRDRHEHVQEDALTVEICVSAGVVEVVLFLPLCPDRPSTVGLGPIKGKCDAHATLKRGETLIFTGFEFVGSVRPRVRTIAP